MRDALEIRGMAINGGKFIRIFRAADELPPYEASWVPAMGMSMKKCLFLLFSAPVFLVALQPAVQQKDLGTEYRRQVEEAALLVNTTPNPVVQYDYVVTGAVRLLLFWVSRDDVGHGYIRIGALPEDPATEIVQLVMGSDPAKAPLGVNNWGCATELWRKSDASGAFFAFMKAPKDDSMATAREEVAKEKDKQRFQYQGIISRIRDNQLVSITVPVSSATDFTLHQFPLAQQMVMEQLKTTSRPPRTMKVPEGCSQGSGFLFALRELIAKALSESKTPLQQCYSYLSWNYRMSIRNMESHKQLKVSLKMRGATRREERTYPDVRAAEFRVVNLKTGYVNDFRVVFGESGKLKGIPVQIEFQPNWWFRVTVNLKPGETLGATPR
jgi:hypothetical protein